MPWVVYYLKQPVCFARCIGSKINLIIHHFHLSVLCVYIELCFFLFTRDAEMWFAIATQVNIDETLHMTHNEKHSAHALIKTLLLKSANNYVKLYESAVVNYRNPLLVVLKVYFSYQISHSGRLSSLFFPSKAPWNGR